MKKKRYDLHARVYVEGKLYPGLNMSRSIGDLLANSVGVSNIPEVKEYTIGEDDVFLIIWSDGIWEFMSNKEVIDEIIPHGKEGIQKGIESLAEKAW